MLSSGSPQPGFVSIGQSVARRMALRTVAGGRLAQPLLVHGAAGSGKRTFVGDLVALLVCAAPVDGIGPCNACRGCVRARSGAHPDVVVTSPEAWRAARQGGESIVSVTRRWLLETAGTPIEAERRVAVVEGSDAMTEQSQNALLKALEEPSPRHVFVLVADDAERLLPTIRSRCQELRIGAVPRQELAAWLVETFGITDDQADLLARLARGRIGLAARFARSADLVAWRRRLQGELLTMLERGRAERFAVAHDAIDEALKLLDLDEPAVDPAADVTAESDERATARTPASRQRRAAIAVVDVWLGLARDLLVTAAGRPAGAVDGALLPEISTVAPRLGIGPLARFIGRLEEIREGLVQNASARLALEVAILEWPSVAPRAA